MQRAFVFPGQGSQIVGMGHDLAKNYSVAREVFEEIDDTLGEKLSEIIFNGPEDELRLTRNTQPAMLAMSMAVVRIIESVRKKKINDIVQVVAGHSLGEYSALAAIGAITLDDATTLLRLRGEAMQNAVPVGEGAMAALLGADLDIAENIIQCSSKGEVCEIANDNSPGQVVISGSVTAIKRAITISADMGVKKAVVLPVSAPFHCMMMSSAAEIMSQALAKTTIHPPLVPIIANVTAKKMTKPGEIRSLLERQITAMVRWRETIMNMSNDGVELVIEVGPGSILRTLTRRIDAAMSAISVGNVEQIENFLESL